MRTILGVLGGLALLAALIWFVLVARPAMSDNTALQDQVTAAQERIADLEANPIVETRTVTETVEVIKEEIVEVRVPYTVEVRSVIAGIGAQSSMTPTLTGGEFKLSWSETEDATPWYRSPFTETTDALTDIATVETLAEPGVLLDATAAFDHMSATDTPVLVPEGGYAYIAVGGVTLSHDGASLTLNYQEKNIYLIIVRGLPSDGTDTDLNQVVLATNYVRATGIYSPMPAGAYVSLGWFTQQVLASYRDPNCGGSGCRMVTSVIVDLATHSYRAWSVEGPENPRNWTRME